MIESKNLLHVFKHNMVTTKELTEFLNANPNIERRIGCLPSDWLKNIDKNKISKVTQLIDDIFEKSAISFSSESTCDKIYKELKHTLKEALNRSDISIEYADSGYYKYCHKLVVGEYSYALSTFKELKFESTFHGRGCEPQNIFTAYKRISHGRVSKPFMARVAPNNETVGGYILSQFIKENETFKIKVPLTPLEIKLQDYDFIDAALGHTKGHNVINGVLIDIGGMMPNHYKLTTEEKKIALNVEQKIMAETNIINKSYQDRIYVHQILDHLKHLVDKGIDLYSIDLHSALKNFEPDEQNVATKIIRVQKRLVKFLQSLNPEELQIYSKVLKDIQIPECITTITKNILHSYS